MSENRTVQVPDGEIDLEAKRQTDIGVLYTVKSHPFTGRGRLIKLREEMIRAGWIHADLTFHGGGRAKGWMEGTSSSK